MFKRRNKRSYLQIAQDSVYPKGGWGRAASYISYRVRRLPDPPRRIARGIAAGVFVSFTPLFGFHFVVAGLLAALMRGNILAAILSTFVGNPLTFPLIAATSLTTGEWILGAESAVPLKHVFRAFSQASTQLWHNAGSIFTEDIAHWDRLAVFFQGVFLPYLIGSIVPGLLAAIAAFVLSKPVIAAYQRRRQRMMQLGPRRRMRKADKPAHSD